MLTFVITLKEQGARAYLNEIDRETEVNRCEAYPSCKEIKCPSKRFCPFYFFATNPDFLERVREEV